MKKQEQPPESRAPRAAQAPKRARVLGAFRVHANPFPWERAIGSGLSSGIPILLGIWLGQLEIGLLACFGGYAFLYVRDEPYAWRAVKLLVVMAGMSLSFAAGALGASVSHWVAACILGVIGAGAVFLAEAFHVPPPGGFMFVFICAVATSFPPSLAAVPLRAGLIFLGGIPAWLIAMRGWLWNPHGPETDAVAGAYRQLAALLAAVGTHRLPAAQHAAALALRSSEAALTSRAAQEPLADWSVRLLRLNEQADAIFLAIIERTAETTDPFDPRVTAAVRALADAVGDPDRAASLTIPQPLSTRAVSAHLQRELLAAVAIAAADEHDAAPDVQAVRTSIRSVLAGALDWRSLVLPKALRIGLMLTISYVIALALGTPRPYWVPLSCGAVMTGPTVVATVQRTVQRLVGTVLGAVLGVLLLAQHPSGMAVAFTAMGLQTLVQLVIVHNYGFAVTFLTPFGLLITEAVQPGVSAHYLIMTRFSDILLGSILGLAGTFLVWPRSASERLPAALSQAIRAEGRLLQTLADDPCPRDRADRHHLQTALINLRGLYDAALNEMRRRSARVEALWPAIISVQRLGFLLIGLSGDKRCDDPSLQSIVRLSGVFDTMADAVVGGQPPHLDQTLSTPEYPAIGEELRAIHEGLQVLHVGGPGA